MAPSGSSPCSASTASSGRSSLSSSATRAPGASGVAREAERQACNRAFSDHDAHRIHAEIPATNQAAQKVVTFLGFRLEGTMRAAIRRGDERVDNQVWGLLAEDFTGWD